MAKKKKHEQESNPFRMVLYIIAVLILMACLVFFVLMDRRDKKAFQEEISKISADETEYLMTERENPTESETETEPQAQTVSSVIQEPEPSDTEEEEPLTEPTEQQTETQFGQVQSETQSGQTQSETQTETETETSANGIDSGLSILVLNGTRKAGVAGYWTTQLTAKGYTNVTPANYNGRIEAETVIYAKDTKKAEQFLAVFPKASIVQGSISSGIEANADGTIPKADDIYIIVGSNDAISS